ncbi:hypothetical protein [Listeria monocytogenes]|uniref:Uncharacterized protein n=1 Tax=Listeria monocytogenes TaxID=1639 RepID=A0A7Z1FAP8_LISMN|nr:hypothetical protein [Listeria monocytogenes]ASH85348.1 hypothetical protein N882_2298 [Listeria monocytogenes serotype 1/2a str. 01-1468]EAA0101409.1 hypothetical protein [Listeria monocytogenes]EAA0137923.1 hypothetical protein [Listeria monocytogenes]EAC2321204.1 hypothetical protein [Listeria monocytogenes]EAC2444946.1 hypothetical protein [Listeria monocytogenes]
MNDKTEFEKGYEEGADDTTELISGVLAEVLDNLQQEGTLTAVQGMLFVIEMWNAGKRLKEKESEV